VAAVVEGDIGERLESTTVVPVATIVLSPESVVISLSGFEFDVTIHLGMDWDTLRFP
jgi:hypothetical protein